MPKGAKRNEQIKRTPIDIVLLLVLFTFIKIGEIPILVFKKTIKLFFLFRFPPFYYQKSILFYKKRIPRKLKITFALGIFFLIFFFYTFFTIQTANLLPSPARLSETTNPITTEFYDRNGKLLYRLYEGRNRSLVELSDLPPYLINATISIEDKNFYKHFGIDLLAISRAMYDNLSTGSMQGASTITQQLVKNSLLTPEKTYSRKIKEVFLSFWAERIYSKDEILKMYLNEAPYGGPAWGIEAASLTYFGKHAKDLSLAEAAFLAGLPASPTRYSPYGTSKDIAKLRQKQVLERMIEEGYITNEQASIAVKEELTFQPPVNGIKAAHFVMYVKDLLSKKYGDKVVSQGGLRITTTLDLGLQEEIQAIVKDEVGKLTPLNVTNGAAIVTDAKTGQILTMVGSKDFFDDKFGNYNVTLSLRQPGSSIKVVTYAEAFKAGYLPGATILDTPVKFKDGDKIYSPLNYDGRFHGPVSIRTALGSSYNIPAVKMLATVGLDNMIQTARDLGITTFTDPKRYGFSLTLGGGEVKMIDMISVYGTLSQNGVKNYPSAILKVTDSSGNILEEYEENSETVLQGEIAYLITNILSDNSARAPAFGPNSLLNIPGHIVAVKTGTSDNKRDNWTFGYTPEFVAGVWVGNNDNSPMNPSLTSGVTGAAPIWNKIMKGILAKREPVQFERPKGIIEVKVGGRKDLAISGILPRELVRIGKKEDQTIFFDAFSSYATSSAITSVGDGSRN